MVLVTTTRGHTQPRGNLRLPLQPTCVGLLGVFMAVATHSFTCSASNNTVSSRGGSLLVGRYPGI